MKNDATYELVIKATNQIGTSMLTEPVKFSTQEKYITSAASLGGKYLINTPFRKIKFKIYDQLQKLLVFSTYIRIGKN